jgi:uncharacterized phage infection (PIP) family protein YhgE
MTTATQRRSRATATTPAIDPALAAMRAERDALRAELEAVHLGIRSVCTVAREAAIGNLEPRILGLAHEGPVGELVQSVNHLLDLSDAFVRESRAALQHASEGKFYRRVLLRGLLGTYRDAATLINAASDQMHRGAQELEQAEGQRFQLADEFEAAIKVVVDSVAAAATEARATAQGLSGTADETARHSDTVSAAATVASHGMESVAAAAEEITATVSEIERQAVETRTIARTAVSAAVQTSETATELVAASQRITRVVKLINDISSQTKLLALNAAIEAARVGELGKGFAVVAAEVKNLATQTGDATQGIEAEIEAMQGATTSVADAIGQISTTVRHVDTLSSSVCSAVSEQRAATAEINQNIQQAARGTRDMTVGMTTVSGAVRETSDAAGQMLEAADELSRMAEKMRSEVDRFLVVIRRGAISGRRAA